MATSAGPKSEMETIPRSWKCRLEAGGALASLKQEMARWLWRDGGRGEVCQPNGFMVFFGSEGQIRGCVAEEMGGRWKCQPFKTHRNIKALGKIWLRSEYNFSLICRGLQSCQIMTDTLRAPHLWVQKRKLHKHFSNFWCRTRTWFLFWVWLLDCLFAPWRQKGWVDCN